MISSEGKAWAALAVILCASLSGCGTPAAPQPPSLNLADPVGDLSATRNGDKVTLTWTMPKRNTDKTAIIADVATRICRRAGDDGPCGAVGTDVMVAPGEPGSFTDTLPGSLASGDARPISYFVELRNKKGRSAGLSNAATVLAGEAPRPVEGLKAELRKQGVVLSWTADGEKAAVSLERKLLTPPVRTQQGPLAPAPEAIHEKLLVDDGAVQGRAIDTTVRFGESYEYRAQRLSRVEVNGKTLELAGEISAPIDVDAKDIFPPDVPVGLAAVAAPGENGAGPAIDLNWQPDTESDLAGYVVYRREGDGGWVRISPATPAIEPAFHDAQIQPGHTYRYAVSAVSKTGHESERSAETQETVPQP